jgi:hypothetical protein
MILGTVIPYTQRNPRVSSNGAGEPQGGVMVLLWVNWQFQQGKALPS